MTHAIAATNLADILERVLDKGIVIAGDIRIQIADIDLLTIKIRLMIASVEKAKEMGINWWEQDSFLSTQARQTELEKENAELKKKVADIEGTEAQRHKGRSGRGTEEDGRMKNAERKMFK